MNRRNAATAAAAGLVATLAPTPALAQEERQEAKLHKVADAEMATNLLNTLANGGKGVDSVRSASLLFPSLPMTTDTT